MMVIQPLHIDDHFLCIKQYDDCFEFISLNIHDSYELGNIVTSFIEEEIKA